MFRPTTFTGRSSCGPSLLLLPALPAALASFPGARLNGELQVVVYYHILPGSLKLTRVKTPPPPQRTDPDSVNQQVQHGAREDR